MRAAFVQLQIKIQSAAVVEQCWSWCCCTLSWDDVDLKGRWRRRPSQARSRLIGWLRGGRGLAGP